MPGWPPARGLVRWAFRFSVCAAAVGLVGLTAVALGGAEPQAAWILAGFIVAAGVLTQIPDAVISGLQQWRDSSVVVLWSSAVGAAATVLVLVAGGGVTGIIAVLARRRDPDPARDGRDRPTASVRGGAALERAPRAVRARTLRHAASVFVGTLVTLVVFRRSEFFFLNHYATDRDIALYSVAFSVMSTLVLVPEALGAVLTPAAATLLGAGQMDRIRSGYARALRLVLLGSLPAVAVGIALGPELVTLLFGPGFRDSRIPLLILLAPFPLIPLMSTSFALIEGLGKVKFPLVAGVASAVLNVALDFALIPSYSTNGAAAANSIAQGISAVAILVYGVRLVGGVRWDVNPLVRMAITSAAVGALAWGAVSAIGGVVGLIVGLALATAALVLLCVLVRVISHDDAAWLRQAFGSMLGGAIGTAIRGLRSGDVAAPPPAARSRRGLGADLLRVDHGVPGGGLRGRRGGVRAQPDETAARGRCL